MYKYEIRSSKRIVRCSECPLYKDPYNCGYGRKHDHRPRMCPLKEILDGDVEIINGMVDLNPHVEIIYKQPNEGLASGKLEKLKRYLNEFYKECEVQELIDELLNMIYAE